MFLNVPHQHPSPFYLPLVHLPDQNDRPRWQHPLDMKVARGIGSHDFLARVPRFFAQNLRLAPIGRFRHSHLLPRLNGVSVLLVERLNQK